MAKEVLDNKCPSCGAAIFFNPTLGKWKCRYCDSEFTLEEMQKYNNASNADYNDVKSGGNYKAEDDTNYVTYICQDCGAQIVADEQTASTFCVYCGNTAILKNKLTGEFAPDYIIPFKQEKKTAIEKFKGLSKGHPLMPRSFNNEKNIEKITGVYIPFWLYDINVSGQVDLTGEKVSSWSSGDTTYTKTDYYKMQRNLTMDFDRVPVDGSTRFDDSIMNSIEPFNYKEVVDYNHAYLSGFLAERYDINNENLFKDAAERTLTSAKTEVLSSCVGYSSKRITNNGLVAKQTKLEYALFPVWMVNVKYGDKYYTFAMNGQTGKFIGNIPIDKKRLLMYSVMVFVICFVILLAISYVMYLVNK